MSRRARATTAAAAPAGGPESIGDALRVAYHDGPPEIGYAGRQWQRGVAQAVTAAEWATMQSRGDCAAFDFRLEPVTPAEEE